MSEHDPKASPHAAHAHSSPLHAADAHAVELPQSTAAPAALALGVALFTAGIVFGATFIIAGLVVFVFGLGYWIADLLPGRGHYHEPWVPEADRPAPIEAAPGTVELLYADREGVRFQIPERVHPTSAGLKGGIIGGLVMPLPALVYALTSGLGIWYPLNLLAGMALPGIETMSDAELGTFSPALFVVGVSLHVSISVVFGLAYGVLLPTLPRIPAPLSWGGLLMPMLWTSVTFLSMWLVNPTLNRGIDWPSFIFAQFIFGTTIALVYMSLGRRRPLVKGLIGGVVGGLVMPLPAIAWGYFSGHGIWYPVNLLVAMFQPSLAQAPLATFEAFRADWLAIACGVHIAISLGFGLLYGLVIDKLPAIPAPLAWGGFVMPLFWTGACFGMMGIVNPLLQARVEWPWFIVSQFVFGITAAIVVVFSETLVVPPLGGPKHGGPALSREA